MDPVTMVCGTVVVALLLGTPAVCISSGWKWRGTAADEGQKRHTAEMALKERELTEWKTLADLRKTAIVELDAHYQAILKGVGNNANKAQERAAILSGDGSPTDIALKLLQSRETASTSNSGEGGSKDGATA